MELPKNRFKAALKAGQSQIGLWGSIPSSYTAEVVAGAGFDWFLIDTEHSPTDIEVVLRMVQAVAGYPATEPVVRVPWNDIVATKRVLDIGVRSIMIPQITTVEEAKTAVSYVRFPTAGQRGVAGLSRSSRFGRVKNYFPEADGEICLLLQLESEAALKNIEAIAAIDGVDGLFIGPADLTVIDDAIKRIAKAGKAPGILMANEELAKHWLKLGATFVAVGADVGILARGADALAAKYRG
jgi:4-hydroxy-2-oxoheptanedioate aldolase